MRSLLSDVAFMFVGLFIGLVLAAFAIAMMG